MSIKKILKELSPEEITESYVLPVDMTESQIIESRDQLSVSRRKRRSEMTDDQKLYTSLIQLRIRLDDYIKGSQYKPEFNFGYFLEQYISLINKKKKDFAKEIDIHTTLLSQYINKHREPNESMFIRLEIHSGNTIPAVSLLKLVGKEKEHLIKTDHILRKKEEAHVSNKLELSL